MELLIGIDGGGTKTDFVLAIGYSFLLWAKVNNNFGKKHKPNFRIVGSDVLPCISR